MGFYDKVKSWFRPSRKALPAPDEGKTYGVLVTTDGFTPVVGYMGDNLESVVTSVVYAYACVTANADEMASLPCIAQRKGRDGEASWVSSRGGLLDEFISSPGAGVAATWGWRRLLETIAQHLMLAGAAILHIITVGESRKLEIWEPSKVTVERKSGVIIGYKYGGRVYPPSSIVHISNTSPTITSDGMAPLSAARRSMDIDYIAHGRTEANLTNRVAPGMVLTLDGSQASNVVQGVGSPGFGTSGISPERKASIISEVEDAYQQMNKDGKLMVLSGGWKLAAAPQTNYQLDYIDIRRWSRDEIMAIFRTPPPVIGVYENATLQNFNTALKVWWISALFPLLETIYEALNKQLVEPWLDSTDERLWYDISGSPIAIELLERKLAMASLMIKDHGVPTNDAYAFLGVGLEPFEGGDQPNIAFTIAGRDNQNEPSSV